MPLKYILGNLGMTHSVPAAFVMNAVGTDECSGYGMDHAWVTDDECRGYGMGHAWVTNDECSGYGMGHAWVTDDECSGYGMGHACLTEDAKTLKFPSLMVKYLLIKTETK